MMREDIKGGFPTWCKFKNEDSLLVIGDDLDSLLTAMVLQHVNGNEIGYFYDFENMYESNDILPSFDRIGCDMALMNGKCWDNHVTLINDTDSVNDESANLNNMFRISGDNYTDKYAGSTLLLVWSYFDLPLPKTREGKLILLAVDSAYLGHYSERYREVHNEWFRKLGFEELIDFLNEVEESEFDRVNKEYSLKAKIGLSGGKLTTKIDLKAIREFFSFEIKLPEAGFIIDERFNRKNLNLKKLVGKSIRKRPEIFSFALTYRNNASYTTK